jgi:hypothetical protein
MNDKKKTTPARPPVADDAYEEVYGYPVRPGTIRPILSGRRVG